MAYDGSIRIQSKLDTGQLENSLKSLGKLIAGGALAVGVKNLAGSVVEMGMGFESALSGIKSVSGATSAEMEKLRDLAVTAGEDTVYSAAESAQAIEELLKAGLEIEQVLGGGLTGALDLAAAGELGLADAAEIASTALNAFKDDNLNVADAANILAGAANASATDVGEMKFGLSAASAVASSMGMNFMDASTALAVFAQNGLKGSDAGTSLKTMLMRLQPKTDKQIAQFAELGLLTEEGTSAFYDMNGSMKPLADISDLLRGSLLDLNDAERAMALEMMFGSDAIRGANILFKEGAEGVQEMADAMLEVKAADVAAERLDNLAGDVEYLGGSLETLGIQIYENLNAGLRTAVQSADVSVSSLSRTINSPAMQEAFTSIGEGIASMVKSLGNAAEVAVPLLANAFSFLVKHGDVLNATLMALVAGFVAFKILTTVANSLKAVDTAMKAASVANTALTISLGTSAAAAAAQTGAITLSQAVIGIFAKRISLAAAAQALWNGVLALSPLAPFAIALGAVVGVVALVASKLKAASKEIIAFGEAIETVVLENQTLIDSINESDEAYESQTEGIRENINNLRDYSSELLSLSENQNLSGDEMAKMTGLVKTLNEAMPSLGLSYDEYTGSLNMSSEAMSSLIDLEEKRLNAEAAQERVLDLEKRRLDIGNQLAQNELERSDFLTTQNELLDGHAEALDSATAATLASEKGGHAYKKVMEEVVPQLEAWETAEQQLQEELKNVDGEIDGAIKAIGEYEIAMHGASSATEDASEEMTSAWERYLDTLDDDSVKAALKSQEQALADWVASGTSLYDKISLKSKTSLAEMADTIKHNRDAMNEYAANMQKLSDIGLSASFLDEINRMGKDGAALAKQIADSVESGQPEVREAGLKLAKELDEGLQENQAIAVELAQGNAELIAAARLEGYQTYDQDIVNAAAESADEAAQAVSDKEPEFFEAGANAGQGVADGVISKKGAVIAANTELANAGMDAYRAATDQHSPSKKYKKFGEYDVQGLINGWLSGKGDLLSTIENVAKSGQEKYSETFGALEENLKSALANSTITAAQVIEVWNGVASAYGNNVEAQAAANDKSLKAAEDWITSLKSLYGVSAKDEMKLWDSVRQNYEINTQSRAQADQQSFKATKAWLDERKLMIEVSADDEVKFWEKAVKKYKEGTAARLEADKELLAAKRKLFEEEKKIEIERLELAKKTVSDQYKASEDAALESADKLHQIMTDGMAAQKESISNSSKEMTEIVKSESEARIKQYEREFNEQVKLLDAATSAEVGEIQAQIDAIDQQTSMENEAERRNKYFAKLRELQNDLAIADEQDKAKILKEINQLTSEENRRLLLLNRDREKAALREQINDIKNAASDKKAVLEEEKSALIESEKARTQITLSQIEQRTNDQLAALDIELKALQSNYKIQQQDIKDHYDKLKTESDEFYDGEISKTKDKFLKATDALAKQLDSGLEEIVDIFGKKGKKAVNDFLKDFDKISKKLDKIKNEFDDFSKSAGGLLPGETAFTGAPGEVSGISSFSSGDVGVEGSGGAPGMFSGLDAGMLGASLQSMFDAVTVMETGHGVSLGAGGGMTSSANNVTYDQDFNIVIEGQAINNSLDETLVSRQIAKKTAKAVRYEGGFA